MSVPAPAGKPVDPQAAIAKHSAASGAGNEKDAAIIAKVEAQLANSPMGWLNSMLSETSSKASEEEGAAKEKADEYDSEVEKNKKDAPPDAGAPPPKGSAAKAAVNTPASAAGGDKGAPAKKGGGEGKGKQPAKAGGKGASKGGAKGAGAAAVGDTIIAKLAAGDGDIGAALDAYAPKSPEAKENMAKVAQMAKIAEGFKGSLDMYVADGGMEGAIATAANWIGEGKNVAAIWANNPYKKADGALGTIMKVLSVIKSVTGLVGSICGKLGLVLTVIGLLGMIFPPIGAAVSGIARILNVVGLICDAVSFVLSAVLTGLGGVKLAQLIASGASPEEKAAAADMLVSEANDAAGGLISLAMQFGPKFMKGMLGKSKGILSGLIKRAKAVIGNITAKISGNVKNFVNKIVRKLGFGGVKGRMVNGVFQVEKGAMSKLGDAIKNAKPVKAVTSTVQKVTTAVKGSKVWNKPADMVKGARNKLMAKYGDSKFAKWCDNVAVKSNNVADKLDLEMKVEKLGEKAGGIGENWNATKKLNAGTEAIEQQTASYNKHLANQDMGNLIEERKKRLLNQSDDMQAKNDAMKADGVNRAGRSDTLAERNKLKQEAGNVGNATRKEVEDKAAAAQTKATSDATEAEAKEAAEKAAKEARQADPEKYANEAAETRKKRYELEDQHSGLDDERKRLKEIGEDNLTQEQKNRLKNLDRKLKPLDEARAADDLGYKTMSGGSSQAELPKNSYEVGKQGYDAFKAGRDVYDTFIHAGEDGPIDRSKNWESAESFDFKNPLKWNKGSAASNASKRAGDDAKTKMGPAVAAPEDTSKADFHAFVTKKAAATSIASTATSMLSRIKKKDAAAAAAAGGPAAGNAPAANMPAAATSNAGATTTQPAAAANAPAATANAPAAAANAPAATANAPAVAAKPAAGAPPGAIPAAPAPEPAPPEPVAPSGPAADAGTTPAGADGGDAGDGGADPLPYWPALEGDYNKALGDFGLMRKIAVEFKKAQIAAKQQAVDTLAVYGKYDEYAAKRQADAKAHGADTTAAGTAVAANATAANAGETSSAQGAAKQDEAKGTAGQKAAVDLPEPEVRGFWGRIIGRIKRWAKQKAAELFGWIQEKIANIILKGLCGVSMGDLKAYSGALKNQQNAAKGVADTGAKTADTAAAKETEVKTTAQKETAKAEADIAECDQNTNDAETFLGDVNAFEQQLKAEAANAAAFIAQVTSAVTAERAKRKAEAEQAAQEAEKQAAAAAAAAAGGANDDATQSTEPNQSTDQVQTQSNETGQTDDAGQDPTGPGAGAGESDEEDPAALEIIGETKSYIGGAGDIAVSQLESKKDDYKNQIEASTTNKDKDQAKALEPKADGIITEFKGHLTEVKSNLESITGTGEDVVAAIVDQAKGLDEAIAHANQTLDQMFTSLYDTIRTSKKTMGNQAMQGVNDAAAPVNDAAQGGLDAIEPGAEKAWGAGKDVAGAVANPLGNAAEWAGGGLVGAGAWVGAGATVGMVKYGEAQANSGVPMIPY